MMVQPGNGPKRRRVEEQRGASMLAATSNSSAAVAVSSGSSSVGASQRTASSASKKTVKRVTGGANSSPVVEHGSSSSSVGPASPAVNPARKQVYDAILPSTFRNLLVTVKVSDLLIIDLRNSGSYREKKIDSSASINAPLENIGQDGDPSVKESTWESKLGVILILEQVCPALLLHLRPPGHYTHVIIIDDKSTCASASEPIKLVRAALVDWNSGTRTRVLLIEGGFSRMSDEFPTLIINTSGNRTYENETPTLPQLQLSQTSGNLEAEKQFLTYLEELDNMISDLRTLITMKSKIVAIECVESLLRLQLTRDKNEVAAKLDASTPEPTKCPVCFTVFQSQILQCGNGHNICSKCIESLNYCPQCRATFANMVRNRGLEEIIEKWWEAECVCGGKINLKELDIHKLTCGMLTRTSLEIAKVEGHLGVTNAEFEGVNRFLGKSKTSIAKTESLWDKKLNEAQKANQTVWTKLWDYRSAKKMAISTLEQTLFSIIS